MFLKNITNILTKYNHFAKTFCSVPKKVLNINMNDVNVSKYIIQLEKEYERLKSETPSSLLLEQQQRLEELQQTINILELRKGVMENINNLDILIQDKDVDIRQLAEEEKCEDIKKLKQIDENLLESLLPVDKSDNCNAIMIEVNAGVGGQEAMLFAKELFSMYCNFAEYKNWSVEIADYLETELGGIRHASALINGLKVFQYFKYEAGVHRVQRIPTTEKSSRIHTSTVSVLALPQPTDIQIHINNTDLRIETKRASGAGGQHVNTTDSAVRITHIPTGLSVECQVNRSQHKNRSLALQKLNILLYNQQLQNQMNEIENTKKSQVRSNFRNEKIRTYNFNQDRITDHRLPGANVHNLKVFLEGGASLENLIVKLHNNVTRESLLNIVRNLDENKNLNKS